MFGKSNAADGTEGGGALSVLGSDVTVTGDIAADGDLHVDGAVEGDITCRALVQGAGGRIKGTVRARTVRLAGAIEGAVVADRLLVEASARITGDLSYGAVAIAEGAQVDGRMIRIAGEQADAGLRLVENAAG